MSKYGTSREIYEQACEVLPGGISRNTVYRKPHPHYVSRASGCFITDVEGVTRIDFANNMASLIHGHSHPEIIKAVTEQLQNGTAYTMASESEINLAELICGRAVNFEKIRFMNSGTEAVMAMIKASRAYTGRPKIAKAEGSYHGTYDFAEVSQTSNPANWGDINKPNRVPLAYGTPEGVLNDVIIYPFNDTEKTIKILNEYAGNIACVLIDPVPHRIGFTPASEEFISALYEWTRKNGALLVFDEVITFRTNYGGAAENYSVKPDLASLGKIIGGGFPIGAVAGKSEIMKVFDPRESKLLLPHSGTFSANPVSMTAGYTAMKMFDRKAVIEINALTQKAKEQINDAIKTAGVPVSLAGAGSMFRIHLKETPPQSYRDAYQNPETAAVISELNAHLFYKENLLLSNICSCMLSTAISQKEVDRLSEGLLNGFRLIKPRLEKLNKT
jgi:glutamate-1-semialdehyde 2,1-aminomutase